MQHPRAAIIAEAVPKHNSQKPAAAHLAWARGSVLPPPPAESICSRSGPGGGVGNFFLLAASLSASACCFVTSTNRPSRLRAGALSVEIAATAAGELLSICAASAGGWNVEAAMQRARHTRRLDRR